MRGNLLSIRMQMALDRQSSKNSLVKSKASVKTPLVVLKSSGDHEESSGDTEESSGDSEELSGDTEEFSGDSEEFSDDTEESLSEGDEPSELPPIEPISPPTTNKFFVPE